MDTIAGDRQGHMIGLKLLVALSCSFFLTPILENSESVGLASALYVAVGFSLILGVEAFLVYVVRVLSRELSLWPGVMPVTVSILVFINFGYFFYVLLGGSKYLIVILASAILLLIFLSFRAIAVYRAVVIFAAVFPALSAAKALYVHYADGTASYRNPSAFQPSGSKKRNVYVILFDALAARGALSGLYNIDAPFHVAALESMGFEVYDKISADEATRNSLGRTFSFGVPVTSRTRYPFDGLGPVPLYEALAKYGYKIQFIDTSDSLEGNVGGIDYYFPQEARGPSVCRFVDKRYGIFLCRPWFLEMLKLHTRDGWVPDNEKDFDRILARLSYAARDRSSSWFSFGYFYYPGHTDTAYRYSDEAARASYIEKMNVDVRALGDYFGRAFASITAHDPNAIIVFFGDHGSWLTRGLDPIDSVNSSRSRSQKEIILDRRGVMLAVYPKEFCRKAINEIEDLGFLFKAILPCLQTALTPGMG